LLRHKKSLKIPKG